MQQDSTTLGTTIEGLKAEVDRVLGNADKLKPANWLPNAGSAVSDIMAASHLPVMVDPSHGTGKSHLVPAMCRAAVAAGADGLIVETHADPEHAMTDGAQSLTPKAFEEMMKSVRRIALAVDREA